MPNHRYIVGTRDTEDVYRPLRIEAPNMIEARFQAVRRLEDAGIYARTTDTCYRINRSGERIS